MAEDGASLLHLPIDQLDLLFHFLQHLGKAALLENRLRSHQVLLRLLWPGWVVDHVQSADHLKCLRDIHASLTVQSCLKLLNLFHFLECLWDHAKLESDEGDVALDASRSLVDQPIVVLEDRLSLLQALKSILKLHSFLLELGQSDCDVGEELSVGVFLQL